MDNDVLTMADYYDANDGFGNMITWLYDVLDEKEFYALKVVTDLNGNTSNSVDDFLKCVFGYDFEQFYEQETQHYF